MFLSQVVGLECLSWERLKDLILQEDTEHQK